MLENAILRISPIGMQWPVENPFLFCAHHHDQYPKGDGKMGPAASLAGKQIGQDFNPLHQWRMYHGDAIPGFPVHPHRGFETITIVTKGIVDHSDSYGQAGRYGKGDVQWMTAGAGLQHSEMFPLLHTDQENTLELFQVWLNLPAAKKMSQPHFKMLWAEQIPIVTTKDSEGKAIKIKIIAGKYNEIDALAPAPDSWAADEANHVNIWLISMEEGALFHLPANSEKISRNLFFYEGGTLQIGHQNIAAGHAIQLQANKAINIRNLTSGNATDNFLVLLEGKPINEPIAQYGPFVMNTEQEIRQAFQDYQKNSFGGWPWPKPDQVHDAKIGRFAKYSNGITEKPPSSDA